MISPLSNLPNAVNMTATITPVSQKTSHAIFVPYWSFTNQPITATPSDTLLYFGISTTTKGVDTDDQGYKKLEQFQKLAPENAKKLLVIRMIDSDVNSKVLDDPSLQEKIISESIETAAAYEFSGIVLDFEIKALAFDSVTRKITDFYTRFSKQTRAKGLQFDVTLYGDTYYRLRPYDVSKIGELADTIYIMTYDFHKSGGNPGPNFPLSGTSTYGYDLERMLTDFAKDVSLEKVVVTLGLFGYDWTVDTKKQSITSGAPLSYLEIKQNYLTDCTEKDCVIKRDEKSSETEITYTDGAGKKHVIWFEDPISVEKKHKFLKTNGLNSTALWAYSYY